MARSSDPVLPDPETVYRLLVDERWEELLAFVHRHHAAIDSDDRLAQAVATFFDALFATLNEAEPALPADMLERLFLLHTGGFYTLPSERFTRTVSALVRLHTATPEVALGYALHCPDHPDCAAVIRTHGAPSRAAHTQDDVLELRQRSPLAEDDATISLFGSNQEHAFFLALREVFATYLVYPNVALASLIDYGRIRSQLSGAERTFFFRGRVDCVVFDQHAGYRPRYFFELDSPFHDDEGRQANDRHKERILALAGQTLYRVRYHARNDPRGAFVQVLRDIIRESQDDVQREKTGEAGSATV